METLVVVEQHRNQYYGRMKHHYGPARVGSPPSRGFREINCRTFQSGTSAGILPTPVKSRGSHVGKRGYSSPGSPPRTPSRTPSPPAEFSKMSARSAPIPIKTKPLMNHGSFRGGISNGNVSFSELWAGPTYSNSPPPSSLPMPKFSLTPRRTVSLELPSSTADSNIEMYPTAKSAPASPLREHNISKGDIVDGAMSATQTLRRMLNLDIADD